LAQTAIVNVIGLPGPLIIFNQQVVGASTPFGYSTYNDPTNVWTYQQSISVPGAVTSNDPYSRPSLSQYISPANGQQIVTTYLSVGLFPTPNQLFYATTTAWGPFQLATNGAIQLPTAVNTSPSSVVFNGALYVFYIFYNAFSGVSSIQSVYTQT